MKDSMFPKHEYDYTARETQITHQKKGGIYLYIRKQYTVTNTRSLIFSVLLNIYLKTNPSKNQT